MRVFRTILTLIGCLLIALGIYSAATFLMERDFASPSANQTVSKPEQEEIQPEPEEPVEEEPEEEEPGQTEDPEQTARIARAQEIIADMTLEEKIYQLMYLTPEAVTGVDEVSMAGDATRAALESYPVGGLIYKDVNLTAPDQAEQLLTNTLDYMQQADQITPFLGVLDAGGNNSPVAGNLETTPLDSFADCGSSQDSEAAKQLGEDLGNALQVYQFNVNFAAGAELYDNSDSFSSDAQTASDLVSAYVEGLQSKNVAAVLSHFPGEASATNGVISKSKEELQQSDLMPFISGIEAGAKIVQVSNLTATSLDSVPCCLSTVVMTDLLREELGFTGVIMTDPLGGQTISASYDPNEAAVLALEAGADMLYGLNDPEAAYTSILAAMNTGTLSESRIDESVQRILCLKLELGLIE